MKEITPKTSFIFAIVAIIGGVWAVADGVCKAITAKSEMDNESNEEN